MAGTNNSKKPVFESVNDCIHFLRARQTNYIYVLFNFSTIENEVLRAGYADILVSGLVDLVRSFNGVLYSSKKGIIFLALQNTNPRVLEKRLEAISVNFSRDNDFLIATNSSSFSNLYRLYDNKLGFDVFMQDLIHFQAPEQEMHDTKRFVLEVDGQFHHSPINLKQVARIEEFIPTINLSSYVDISSVYVMSPGSKPDKFMVHTQVDHKKLCEVLLPNVSLQRREDVNNNVFKIAQKRLLRLLINSSINVPDQPIALTMSYETIFSNSFLEFLNTHKWDDGLFFVVCVDFIDMLTDPESFEQAKNFVRDKGHILALSGIDFMQLRYIQVESLDYDFVLIDLPANIEEVGADTMRNVLAGFVNSVGAEKIILNKCDSLEKATIGMEAGVVLFMDKRMEHISRLYMRNI